MPPKPAKAASAAPVADDGSEAMNFSPGDAPGANVGAAAAASSSAPVMQPSAAAASAAPAKQPHSRRLAASSSVPSGTAASAAASAAPEKEWESLSQREQIMLLTDAEALDVLLATARSDESFLADIKGWDPGLCESVCDKLRVLKRSLANMRKDIRRKLDMELVLLDQQSDEEEGVSSSDDSDAAAAKPARTRKPVPASPHPKSTSKNRSVNRALIHDFSDATHAASAARPSVRDPSPRPLKSTRAAALHANAALDLDLLNKQMSPKRDRSRSHSPAGRGKGKKKQAAVDPPRVNPRANLKALGSGGGDSDPDSSDSSSSSSRESDDDAFTDSDGEDERRSRVDSSSRQRGCRHGRREERHRAELEQLGDPDAFAPGFVRNLRDVAGGRSAYTVYKADVIPQLVGISKHATQELLSLARTLDALLASDHEEALELVCRRLGGVHTAVESGNWAMCEKLERKYAQKSFVPTRFLSSALKEVKRDAAIRGSANDSAAAPRASSSSNTRSRGTGRTGFKSAADAKSQSQGDGAGGPSSKKKPGSGKK